MKECWKVYIEPNSENTMLLADAQVFKTKSAAIKWCNKFGVSLSAIMLESEWREKKSKKYIIGVNFGNFKVIVEDAKKVMGHDDTLPYNAKFRVVLDDTEVLISGSAWNDGWGGTSYYNLDMPKDGNMKKAEENYKFIDELLNENVSFVYLCVPINLGLLEVIDYLAEIAIFEPHCCGVVYDKETFIKFLAS